jgi:hypothetical protein
MSTKKPAPGCPRAGRKRCAPRIHNVKRGARRLRRGTRHTTDIGRSAGPFALHMPRHLFGDRARSIGRGCVVRIGHRPAARRIMPSYYNHRRGAILSRMDRDAQRAYYRERILHIWECWTDGNLAARRLIECETADLAGHEELFRRVLDTTRELGARGNDSSVRAARSAALVCCQEPLVGLRSSSRRHRCPSCRTRWHYWSWRPSPPAWCTPSRARRPSPTDPGSLPSSLPSARDRIECRRS